MKDDLRTLLHALADRLTSSLEAAPTTDVPASASATEERRMLAQALAAVADGDVSLGVANGVRATPEGESLGEALRRIRELVTAARDVVATGTDGVEDVRAAAERAADGTSRQRLGIDRILEQLRQVIQRAGELAAAAVEIGEHADRAALLSLNTGIEGLRVGGEVARTLGSLGEELRKLSQKTSGGARDLAGGLRSVGEQARAAVVALEEVRVAARVAAEEATRAATLAAAARRSDISLATAVGGFRALDEETEALIGRLDASAERLSREATAARERLDGAEPQTQTAIRAALDRLQESLTPKLTHKKP